MPDMPERCGALLEDAEDFVYCQMEKGHLAAFHMWTRTDGRNGRNWPLVPPEDLPRTSTEEAMTQHQASPIAPGVVPLPEVSTPETTVEVPVAE